MKNRQKYFQTVFLRHEGKPFFTVVQLFRGNYWRIILAGLFYILKHSAAWVSPIVVSRIINAITEGGENTWNVLIQSAILLGSLVLFNIPMNYLHVHFRSSALRSVESDLRGAIVEKLQQLSIPYHNEMQSGRLQSKMIRDVEAVQTLSEQVFVNLMNMGINITVSLVITAMSNLTIFFFFLITIPVAALTIRAFKKPIEKKNRAFRKEIEKTSADFMEMEEMIPVTRAHALEEVEMKRLSKQAQQVAEEGYRLDIIQANFGSVSWAVFQFFQIVTLVFSGYLALQKLIPVGNLVLYQSYFTTIVTQVTAVIALVPMISKGLESVRSIAELLNSMDVEDYSDKKWIDSINGDLRFEEVSYQYRDSTKDVIRNFCLDVKAGETIAFVGESGAGKSTLINLIIGFLKPSNGRILIDGVDTEELDFRSFRRHISVVPQNSILFSGSIRDNISYGNRDIKDEEIMRAVKAASLETFIHAQENGLDTILTENGGNLSGGQKQRLSIARALVRNPKVIIFDEATSALDSISEKMVLDALEHLVEGRTAFIVAHRISTIRKADKICVLEKGRLVETGSYEELIQKNGLFAQMQKIQSGEIE